eukprot:scaffold1908_cov104-Isochrysis_galbana.AAC.14
MRSRQPHQCLAPPRAERGPCRLVALDILVYAPYKQPAAGEAERAAHESEREAEDAHVAKIEDGLEEARHVRLDEEVVEGVGEDVASGGARGEEGGPRPAVVLVVEQEVGDDDGDADSHHGEDAVHEEHEAVHVVELVVPEGGEDKVHLDEDGAEGQHATERDEHGRTRVPSLVGDSPRDGVDAAGLVECA